MTPEEIAKLPYRPCVGVMLVNDAGQVFVGQRFDSINAAWQMPQGGIEKGEVPQEAALRELAEETGVSADLVTVEGETEEWVHYDLPHDLVPKIWKGRYRGQEQKWFLLRFKGRDDQGECPIFWGVSVTLCMEFSPCGFHGSSVEPFGI
jgi:putative (di)nucleoside polyphosphate hydrolase